MTNRQHTPGPWYVGTEFNDQGRHIYAAQKVRHEDGDEWHPLIACTDDDERLVDWQANAVLIAAAPDLMEALKLAVRQNSHDMVMTGEELRKCEAAINKATLTF
jgi:hypothetical protein